MGGEVQLEEGTAGIKSALAGGVTAGFRPPAFGFRGDRAKKPGALLP